MITSPDDSAARRHRKLARRGQTVSKLARPHARRALVRMAQDSVIMKGARAVIDIVEELWIASSVAPQEVEVAAQRILLSGMEATLGRLVRKHYPVVAHHWAGPRPKPSPFDDRRESVDETALFIDRLTDDMEAGRLSGHDVAATIANMERVRSGATVDPLMGRLATPLDIYDRYCGAATAVVLGAGLHLTEEDREPVPGIAPGEGTRRVAAVHYAAKVRTVGPAIYPVLAPFYSEPALRAAEQSVGVDHDGEIGI